MRVRTSLISLFSIAVSAAVALLAAGGFALAAESGGKRALRIDDLFSMRLVSDPQISPEGDWVAYAVRSRLADEDRSNKDLWMTSWDGARTVQLTSTKEREHTPRFSPDGRWLAFLSARGYEEETDQIWLLNRAGGEAERITDFKGGVSDYVWSPDSKRLALVASDPDPDACDAAEGDEAALAKCDEKTPKPIVIDRYYFKEDESEYLTDLHDHLYLLDVAARKAEILTPGRFDEALPSWSPDGGSLAFVSKREGDPDRHTDYEIFVMAARPGATAKQITANDVPDCDPSWNSRPAWSPDGKSIAIVQGGAQKLIYYATYRLAVIPAAGGPPRLPAGSLDRNMVEPRFSADGKSIYFMLEDDRSVVLAKVPAAGGRVERVLDGPRVVVSYDTTASGRIAVLESTPQKPAEVYAVQPAGALRPLSRQNDAWLGPVRLGAVEPVSFKSKDGTEIHGLLAKPPDWSAGRKYPLVLDIHGGPVAQHAQEFYFDWQAYAARGYLVLGVNPRGSSGRGEPFATAIFADWGHKDAEDVLSGVDHVVARGLADPERLAVGGWSYGGILTNYVIAQDTRFKAAVSGAGSSNFLAGYGTDMYIREYEEELGPPWKSLDTWLKLSFPFLHADKIVTPTLFMCGSRDFNVPLLNSEQMYQALKSLGRDTRLVIYPDQYHSVSTPSYERDILERWIGWYDAHLAGKPATGNARGGAGTGDEAGAGPGR